MSLAGIRSSFKALPESRGVLVRAAALGHGFNPTKVQMFSPSDRRTVGIKMEPKGIFFTLLPNSALISAINGTAIFCLPTYAAAWFEPTSIELHQTGTFEGRSTNGATGLRPWSQLLASRIKIWKILMKWNASLFRVQTTRIVFLASSHQLSFSQTYNLSDCFLTLRLSSK